MWIANILLVVLERVIYLVYDFTLGKQGDKTFTKGLRLVHLIKI